MQCAIGSRFNSTCGPEGASAYIKVIMCNNSYAHVDQGDNPGQATEG